jgi:Ca2+ transporting ATPase
MTGESEDVRKSSAQSPVLLSGSKVLEGQCAALCVAVGVNSQMGLITSLVRLQERGGGGGGGNAAVTSGEGGQGEHEQGDGAFTGSSTMSSPPSTSFSSSPPPPPPPSKTSVAVKEAAAQSVGRREKTVLQGKLERLALSIGRIGFVAGVTCTAVMSAEFTKRVFFSGTMEGTGATPWDWSYLVDYLHFVITAGSAHGWRLTPYIPHPN